MNMRLPAYLKNQALLIPEDAPVHGYLSPEEARDIEVSAALKREDVQIEKLKAEGRWVEPKPY